MLKHLHAYLWSNVYIYIIIYNYLYTYMIIYDHIWSYIHLFHLWLKSHFTGDGGCDWGHDHLLLGFPSSASESPGSKGAVSTRRRRRGTRLVRRWSGCFLDMSKTSHEVPKTHQVSKWVTEIYRSTGTSEEHLKIASGISSHFPSRQDVQLCLQWDSVSRSLFSGAIDGTLSRWDSWLQQTGYSMLPPDY